MPERKPRKRLLCLPLCVAGLLLFAGCSSFNSAWKKANANFQPATAGLAGPWTGTWQSDADGHHDQLQCVISEQDPAHYRARFHAHYKSVFTFNYTVPLAVQSTNGNYAFQGEANLGWLAGGVYHYEGTASSTNFFARYRSKYDHGTFQMGRPSGK